MAKYKVGDKVRIVSKRPEAAAFVDSMVRFLGKEITISKVREEFGTAYYYSEDVPVEGAIGSAFCSFLGVPGWCLWEEWIAGLAEPEKPADESLSVTIHFRGRLTVAELYKNGKVVKVENARCNPKDKYSCAEGARIAVERLFKKTSGGANDASKPKIGDKFVVVWNRSSDCIHHFKIGSVVTLKYIGIGKNIYESDNGLEQIVRDCDVAPYRETTK